MDISKIISKLRTSEKLSQEQLAEKLGISRQAVQKWESGNSAPDTQNLIQIARLFGVTLDSLVFGSDARIEEELKNEKVLKPTYTNQHAWEVYSSQLQTEYRQSCEEGLDIEKYKPLFDATSALPTGINKEKISDALFDIILNAPTREDYEYNEPSTLEKIKLLRSKPVMKSEKRVPGDIRDRIAGAWYGRICGCLLGKVVEGIRVDELVPLLKNSGNYPMHRYILSTDITEQMIASYKFRLAGRCYADKVKCMPVDDDTNYTVLYQTVIDRYGREFTPYDVAKTWLNRQPIDAYCTAERVAYRNFVMGYYPPDSAAYKNPFREWIGAQIRADYFGYINPGDPESASEMAWRDACISHTKNGIYGEMFVSAMIAAAAVEDDTHKIILAGLSMIPSSSRLYERITGVIEAFDSGVSEKEFFDNLHVRYNDKNGHDWCHTISNAEIVAGCLLYGNNDYGRSVCMAVEQGFDTDCNGATVGSVLGMKNGMQSIGGEWTAPLNGTLSTSIIGVGDVSIDSLVNKTLEHINK